MTGPAVGRLRVDGATLQLTPAAAVFAAGLRRPGAGSAGAVHAGPADAAESLDATESANAAGSAESADAAPAAALPPGAAARAERTMADMPYFLGRIVPSFMAYRPDVDRLRALSDRLVLAAGTDSRGELPYRPAAFLAERFGMRLVHFPGGHTGFTTHPAEFGKTLRAVPGS
ncbi:hypothetical protein GCM10010116_13360 [Microbispora rosea subsp. aerata]|nr:hypothetical protein [Microbispora rosea]GGO06711.1 hypothetical protein GCM10010116_13360 [Microbispora rosea subsp. aerata]GIH55057.1 hypothetical protein Mro02_19710 [Microbispora rosea subsp. aerata]GLJ82506.1 hypothetical protein GCM10017588_12310 [Microbispora rosea subsp. aerata]